MEEVLLRVDRPETMEEAAAALLEHCRYAKKFALYGQMGVGKTTLIQCLCRHLGVEEYVSSPTYGLVHEYRTKDGTSIFHLDLYRLDSTEEALEIGLAEYLEDPGYCFIEWPELVEDWLEEAVSVYLSADEEGCRSIRAACGD